MSPRAEVDHLRRRLRQLARAADGARLAKRYPLVFPPKEKPSFYRRLRIRLGLLLRRLGLRRPPPPEPWLPGLNHVESSESAMPLVIWALGADRDTLRSACRGFERHCAALPGFAPVLVTDVADFAFFSRLGWLVEYVPTLAAPAGRYAERKERYLAWRYRDAAAVPISVGLDPHIRPEELATILMK